MDRDHTVAYGDSLWSLSARYYNNPTLWPLIFEYNNLPHISQKTGSLLLDPDLILIGQQLIIPDKSQADRLGRNGLATIERLICRNRARHQQQGGQCSQQIHCLRQCQSNDSRIAKTTAKPFQRPAFKFDLGQFSLGEVQSKGFSIAMRVSGTLELQDTRPLTLQVQVQNFSSLQIAAQREAKTAAGKLVSDTSFIFDTKTRTLRFSNSLTLHSDIGSPSISLTAGTNAQGQPTLTGTMTQELIKGTIDHHTLVGQKIKIEIEVTAGERRIAEPIAAAAGIVSRPPVALGWEDESESNWQLLADVTLVIGAVVVGTAVVVVGTPVAASSVAAITFATAARMIVMGIVRGAARNKLPQGALAAGGLAPTIAQPESSGLLDK